MYIEGRHISSAWQYPAIDAVVSNHTDPGPLVAPFTIPFQVFSIGPDLGTRHLESQVRQVFQLVTAHAECAGLPLYWHYAGSRLPTFSQAGQGY